MKKSTSGFTLVELLVVIVVIAILAAITVVSYSTIRGRALDARRAHDLSNIKNALMSYDSTHDGVPKVTAYTSSYSGWDSSVGAGWLSFLRADSGMMPVDPKNTMATGNNPPAAGNFNYFYTCYLAGTGFAPSAYTTDYVYIGYHKSDSSLAYDHFPVTACL